MIRYFGNFLRLYSNQISKYAYSFRFNHLFEKGYNYEDDTVYHYDIACGIAAGM